MKYSFLLSVLLFAGMSSAFGATILISPASESVTVGQPFTLDINVDSSTMGLFAYQFSLTFNPAVLAAQSITEGGLFASTGDSFFLSGTIDNTSGTISPTADTLLGGLGVSGPGTIAIAQFRAIGSGTSTIAFSPLSDLILQNAVGAQLSVTPESGTVTVSAVPEPGTFSLLVCALAPMLMLLGGFQRYRGGARSNPPTSGRQTVACIPAPARA